MARFNSRAHLLVSFLISCIINTTIRIKGEAREWFLLQNALPSSVRADVCRVIDWSIRLTGLYIIMQLHHKALRLFISVSVVVLTFSFWFMSSLPAIKQWMRTCAISMRKPTHRFSMISILIKVLQPIWCAHFHPRYPLLSSNKSTLQRFRQR